MAYLHRKSYNDRPVCSSFKENPPATIAPPAADVDTSVTPFVSDPSAGLSEQPVSSNQVLNAEVASDDTHVIAPEPEGEHPTPTPEAEGRASGSKSTKVEIVGGPPGRLLNKLRKRKNTKHLKELVVWWKEAHEELRYHSHKVAEMDGEKLNPDWAISSRSFVLRTLVGHDSLELYKTYYLDRDQVLLAQTAKCELKSTMLTALC
ncbi:hypothetical protein Salat_2763400, partial [Sesamum alatum]